METLKFKTNIKCGGCINAITPHLNKLLGIGTWEVDTQNPDKVLTVKGQAGIGSQNVIDTLKSAGYSAENI